MESGAFFLVNRCGRRSIWAAHETSDITAVNPLSPHDALKHHFTSLKTDLIFLQLGVLEGLFPWKWFTNTWQFSLLFTHFKLSSATTRRELRQQFAACSGWRWQCKVRFERVKVCDPAASPCFLLEHKGVGVPGIRFGVGGYPVPPFLLRIAKGYAGV